MAHAETVIASPLTPHIGYLAMTKDATTGAVDIVDGVIHPTQQDAQAAIVTAAASAIATTYYFVMRIDILSGTKCTVT